MTRERSIYLVSTALICGVMAFSAVNFNLANPLGPMKGAFVHLGYPSYFRIELTIAKTLGVLALLIPRIPFKVKEFAYFGFGITLISASIAHFSVGDSIMFVIDPLLFLGTLATSYVYFIKFHRALREFPSVDRSVFQDHREARAVKLLVLGATGGVGSEIVRQAAGRAHEVTAFVRTSERLADWHDRIKVIQGDLLNCGALERVLEGQDVVLSGFGPRLPISKDDRNLLGNFARALTRAMVATRIQRAVVVSTAFLFKDAIIPPAHLVGRLFFPSRGVRCGGHGRRDRVDDA